MHHFDFDQKQYWNINEIIKVDFGIKWMFTLWNQCKSILGQKFTSFQVYSFVYDIEYYYKCVKSSFRQVFYYSTIQKTILLSASSYDACSPFAYDHRSKQNHVISHSDDINAHSEKFCFHFLRFMRQKGHQYSERAKFRFTSLIFVPFNFFSLLYSNFLLISIQKEKNAKQCFRLFP